jgi:hypothetical protein
MVPKLSALKGRDRVKTFRFGDGDDGVSGADRDAQISIDVRQLRYTQVGLAWKVWDSGLLLSSFIYRHRDVFRGKSVLELGRCSNPKPASSPPLSVVLTWRGLSRAWMRGCVVAVGWRAW